MRKCDFVTDMAVERVSEGIVRRLVRVTDDATAKKVGRAKGVYLTYDCTPAALSSEKGLRTVSGLIADALVELAGVHGRDATVLVAGLGNPDVTADSLGGAVTAMLDCWTHRR